MCQGFRSFAVSSRSGSSLMIEMSRIDGLRVFHASGSTTGVAVFVRSFGPESDMMMAPVGAASNIESTHNINTILAYSTSFSLSLLTSSRVLGPRAAWTVALAIQDSAMNTFSLRLRFEPNPISTVMIIRMTMPAIRQPSPRYTVLPSSSLILICAPVMPNRIGSNIIQKISKDVATGFCNGRESHDHGSSCEWTRESWNSHLAN